MTVTATVLSGADGPQEKGRRGEDDLAGHGFDADGLPESKRQAHAQEQEGGMEETHRVSKNAEHASPPIVRTGALAFSSSFRAFLAVMHARAERVRGACVRVATLR